MSNENVPQTVAELYHWLSGRFESLDKFEARMERDVNGIRYKMEGEVLKIEKRVNDNISGVQNNLKEHKDTHWKFATLVISISAVMVAVMTLLMKFIGR